MKRRMGVVASAALILSASFANDAAACACCSEIGQRTDYTGPLESYVRGEIDLVDFAATARLFTNAGYPDNIEGIGEPSDEDYKLKVTRGASGFVFELTDAKGRKGLIVFPLPKTITRFEVDPRAETEVGGTGPALFKEWRLRGPAKLDGSLAAHGRWANAELILHGSGNSCTSAIDFGSWTLSVNGKGIRFAFLGATKR